MQYTKQENKIKITKEVEEFVTRKELKEKKENLNFIIKNLQENLLKTKAELDEVKALLLKADELGLDEEE